MMQQKEKHNNTGILGIEAIQRAGFCAKRSRFPSDFPLLCNSSNNIENLGKSWSPVKQDAFLPGLLEQIGPLEAESVFSDSDTTASVEQSCFCPCCKEYFDIRGVRYHHHLVKCFMRGETKSQFTREEDGKAIKHVRNAISRMDLHFRIGIMESLRRIAQGAGSEEKRNPDFLPASGTNAEARDKEVISLVYAKPRCRISRKRSHSYSRRGGETPRHLNSKRLKTGLPSQTGKLAVSNNVDYRRYLSLASMNLPGAN
mmetsp:Transcript_39444/g.76664  ORF Transcript_39444/g.76664 Transcript_39444/m.76664 type:complete len:257 (-) Transcript_39444:68-838(-)